MNFSLNEVESTGKKAARGSGYPWGLAEDAGKALRWLASHGVDCSLQLANLLNKNYANTLSDHTPRCHEDPWQATRTLCPLISGAALSDRAFMLEAGPISLVNLSTPILIIPFAGFSARFLKQSVTITIDSKIAVTDGAQLQLENTIGNLAETVHIALGGKIESARKLHSRAEPDVEGWNRLLQQAHKTYAPATEESRLRGAGAGLSDND